MTVNVTLDPDLSTEAKRLELVRKFMNIYLYGQEDRPEYFGNHVRDFSDRQPSTIIFLANEFMSETGPGRFVEAAMFPIVQKLFGGELISLFNTLGVTSLTATELKAALVATGIYDTEEAESLFFLGLEHVQVGGGTGISGLSDDYSTRTFLFNTQQFELASSSSNEMVFHYDANQNFFIDGTFYIKPVTGNDDFDFQTDNIIAQLLGNAAILEPMFDPYSLGEDANGDDVAIQIVYDGDGRQVIGTGAAGTYTLADFVVEENTLPTNGSYVEFAATAIGLSNDLEFYLDDQGREIVYGTNGGGRCLCNSLSH